MAAGRLTRFWGYVHQDQKDQDEAHYGLKGSPTQVEKMFNPDRNDNKVVLKGDADSLAKQLFDVLKDNKYLGE